jgi:ATP-binding cassette subfamily F protein 3
MVQSRIKALGRMETVAEILSDPTLCFKFPSPEPLSSPILQMTDVAFGYDGYKGAAKREADAGGGADGAVGAPSGGGGGSDGGGSRGGVGGGETAGSGGGVGGGAAAECSSAASGSAAPAPLASSDRRLLFENVSLGLDMESRVALVGPNGVGKSTLLKILLGELQPGPDSTGRVGSVTRASRLRIGYFSQHHVDQLDLRLTALESFQKAHPLAKPLAIRAHLGGMGLGGTLALQRMSTLSGGQKSRVAFAQIMWQAPHLLLLDEPTNHLDLDAVEALIHALVDFDGVGGAQSGTG